MELGLAGKTAIVTGGASNIGRAIALALAKEGVKVAIADYDETQGEKVAAEIAAQGGEALAVPVDVTDPAQAEQMVAKTLEKFANLDILVNNAGGFSGRVQLFQEETREKWEKIVALNLWGVIHCTNEVLPHMTKHNGGRIINLGSDAGRIGEFKQVMYSGTKGGVIAFSKAIAKEIGRYGITVNVVCPGAAPPKEGEIGEKSMWSGGGILSPEQLEKATKAYPLRRLGEAEDIAHAVVFFASDAASYITGQTLSVSGGYTTL